MRIFRKQLVLFLLLFGLSSWVFSQEPNDCVNAITICGNSSFTFDVNGEGVEEVQGLSTCQSGENNSIWFELTIETSGTLAFTLTPSSSAITEDYDFFLFGPNATCDNLGQTIRCSTTNPAAAGQGNNLTGMSPSDPDPNEGPGADGDSFVSDLDVVAGETFFLVIDRPVGNSPFLLEWTGTATFPDNPINPLLPNPNVPEMTDLDLCDSVAPFDDAITEIDLTDISQGISNGQNNIDVSFHNSESDAIININPLGDVFTSFFLTQIVFIRIQNSVSGCFIINRMTINVTSLNNFNNPTAYLVCDDDSDGDNQNGLATFDFNTKSEEIVNGISGANLNISYYLSQTDAEQNNNPLPSIYNNPTPNPIEIFVRIEDLDLGCIGFTSFNIEVEAIPVANGVTLLQCDEDGIPEGFTTFNLTEAYGDITDNNPDSTVNFYLSQDDAQNDSNAIDPNVFNNFLNPQILYTRVTNTNTGCINFSELSLEVSTTASNNASLSQCDDDGTEDGFASFNLNDANTIVLAGSPAGLDLNYYETYDDALLEINPLGATFTNTVPYNQTIYARVENDNACFGISEIELTVFELPQIETQFETLYCLNNSTETIILDAGLINDLPNNYTFEWSTGETTSTIEVNVPGTYTVRVFNTDGCFKDRTINVLPSNIATITDIEVVDASQNNTITVFVSGEGDYEFALDNINGPYQDSNIFLDVLPGLYTVFVRDKNDCGIVDELVSVIGFPKFFTPNGDDENEFWQVKGISDQFQANSKILIFDRYGKLLIELDPLSTGWDGTYNGATMPASDYWFQVKLQDGRTFTSHFALKR
ncbi:MAG: T9SS type B sorting domain-containing protein [Winogradskyella sp.]|uniref:T9SS type B sorting domain-containing protein n=1 Tax=Winogradskyella sp. TaxID=1883156 RepID=UPI0025EA1EB0|nr:T9SS type B sorting domain-containing protein [Winogradskyella sp.]NRB58531.1 T9SS type B sorting domain-containing protein [Winogradskyella sp.]